MRGALLRGLGLNPIKQRAMRRSYGVSSNPVFDPDQHLDSRKYIDIDGTTRCKDVMEWFARKVSICTNDF
jgi:hypothetical protein